MAVSVPTTPVKATIARLAPTSAGGTVCTSSGKRNMSAYRAMMPVPSQSPSPMARSQPPRTIGATRLG